ncbi:ATP-binding protein [Streptomyces hydrogenans]|uniref:ATP-binding protein n=1 Tax=Streptomyces hydrogenans TaxID=1873719 RepID=UPI003327DF82
MTLTSPTGPALGVAERAHTPAAAPGTHPSRITHGGALALPAQPRYAAAARRFAQDLAEAWGMDRDVVDTLVLIVGELAANAAQHGGVEMYVKVWIAGPELCVEVTDTGPLLKPADDRDPASGECGRGLGIVDLLTDWCAVDHGPLTRRVRAGFGVVRYSRR